MSSFKTIKITRIDETNKRFEILFDNSSPTVLNDYKAHLYKNDLIIKDELSGNVDRINFRQVQVRVDETDPYQTFDNGRLLDEYLLEIGFYPSRCCTTNTSENSGISVFDIIDFTITQAPDQQTPTVLPLPIISGKFSVIEMCVINPIKNVFTTKIYAENTEERITDNTGIVHTFFADKETIVTYTQKPLYNNEVIRVVNKESIPLTGWIKIEKFNF